MLDIDRLEQLMRKWESKEDYSNQMHLELTTLLFSSCAAMIAEIRAGRKDVDRMDYMERHLCRAGEVKNDAGQTTKLCRVWSIMGELGTLRETVDAFKAANDAITKEAP